MNRFFTDLILLLICLMGNLVLGIEQEESVFIETPQGDVIRVKYVERNGAQIRLVFDCPNRDVEIFREKVYLERKKASQEGSS